MQKTTESTSRTMKVIRTNRVARVSRDVCLNDVLNFICNAKQRRVFRIIENVLVRTLAKKFGTPDFLESIPLENVEMFILTTNNKEFSRLEQALEDRRRAG
jgi:hypothetical protein